MVREKKQLRALLIPADQSLVIVGRGRGSKECSLAPEVEAKLTELAAGVKV